MKFILYLLYCIGAVFGIYSGGTNTDYKEACIGLAIIILIIGLFLLFLFLLSRRTNLSYFKSYLFSILIVVGIIGLFCVVSIVVEIILFK